MGVENEGKENKNRRKNRLQREYAGLLQKMTLMEDGFSSVVFEDKLALQDVLRILLGQRNLEIQSVITQKSIRNLYGHSSVLDIWAKDDEKRQINLEIQNKDMDDHVRRTRFVQGQMDTHSFPKGMAYREMPELFLIFLTRNDFLHSGRWKVEINRTMCGKPEVSVPNGVHEYYINLEQPPETEVVRCLLGYIKNTNDSEIDVSAFPNLAARVNYLKEEKGGKEDMGEVMDQIWKMGEEAGMERGMEKGTALHVIRLVLRMNYDKGMDRMEISELIGEDESLVDEILLTAEQTETKVPEQVYRRMLKE